MLLIGTIIFVWVLIKVSCFGDWSNLSTETLIVNGPICVPNPKDELEFLDL